MYVIPLKFSYSALDAVFFTEAKRFTVTASDGYSWTSNWTSDAAMMLPDGAATNQNPRAFIDIPWPVHDRLMGGPVTIRMEFLMDEMQGGITIYITDLAGGSIRPRPRHLRPGPGLAVNYLSLSFRPVRHQLQREHSWQHATLSRKPRRLRRTGDASCARSAPRADAGLGLRRRIRRWHEASCNDDFP